MRLLSLLPLLTFFLGSAALSVSSLPIPPTTSTISEYVQLHTRARGCDLLSACFNSLKHTLQGVGKVPERPGRSSNEHRYSSIALSRMPSYRASSSVLGAGSHSPVGSPPRPPLPRKARPELVRAKSPVIAPTAPPGEVKMARGRGRGGKVGGKVPYLPPPPSGPVVSAAAQERVWKGARDDVSALMDGSSSRDRKSTLAALKGKNGSKKPAPA